MRRTTYTKTPIQISADQCVNAQTHINMTCEKGALHHELCLMFHVNTNNLRKKITAFTASRIKIECSRCILYPQGSTGSSTFWSQLKAHISLITTPKISVLKEHWTSKTSIFFISDPIEDLKFNQYRHFQLILLMHFLLMRYFVNSIIFRVSIDYCIVYWNRLWKIENTRNIHITSKVSQCNM